MTYPLNPLIITKTYNSEKVYDLYSLFFKERKIILDGEIDNESSRSVITQLMHLDEEDDTSEIIMYINSPGGSLNDGLAIYDTMQFVNSPITTVCTGLAASMAQVLLCAGEPGRRFTFPHSRIMMHQPSGGAVGQSSDIKIYYDEMIELRNIMYKIIQKHTGKSVKEIEIHADRDKWMSSKEALKYNIVDKIITSKKDLI